jgi:hypothetical protein
MRPPRRLMLGRRPFARGRLEVDPHHDPAEARVTEPRRTRRRRSCCGFRRGAHPRGTSASRRILNRWHCHQARTAAAEHGLEMLPTRLVGRNDRDLGHRRRIGHAETVLQGAGPRGRSTASSPPGVMESGSGEVASTPAPTRRTSTTTWRAGRASQAGQPTRSSTYGRRSTCGRAVATWRRRTPTSIQFATTPRSRN